MSLPSLARLRLTAPTNELEKKKGGRFEELRIACNETKEDDEAFHLPDVSKLTLHGQKKPPRGGVVGRANVSKLPLSDVHIGEEVTSLLEKMAAGMETGEWYPLSPEEAQCRYLEGEVDPITLDEYPASVCHEAPQDAAEAQAESLPPRQRDPVVGDNVGIVGGSRRASVQQILPRGLRVRLFQNAAEIIVGREDVTIIDHDTGEVVPPTADPRSVRGSPEFNAYVQALVADPEWQRTHDFMQATYRIATGPTKEDDDGKEYTEYMVFNARYLWSQWSGEAGRAKHVNPVTQEPIFLADFLALAAVYAPGTQPSPYGGPFRPPEQARPFASAPVLPPILTLRLEQLGAYNGKLAKVKELNRENDALVDRLRRTGFEADARVQAAREEALQAQRRRLQAAHEIEMARLRWVLRQSDTANADLRRRLEEFAGRLKRMERQSSAYDSMKRFFRDLDEDPDDDKNEPGGGEPQRKRRAAAAAAGDGSGGRPPVEPVMDRARGGQRAAPAPAAPGPPESEFLDDLLASLSPDDLLDSGSRGGPSGPPAPGQAGPSSFAPSRDRPPTPSYSPTSPDYSPTSPEYSRYYSIRPGSRVVINGAAGEYQGAPSLNGRRGTVVFRTFGEPGDPPDSIRWAVDVDGGERLAVLEANLTLVPRQPAGDADEDDGPPDGAGRVVR